MKTLIVEKLSTEKKGIFYWFWISNYVDDSRWGFSLVSADARRKSGHRYLCKAFYQPSFWGGGGSFEWYALLRAWIYFP